MNDHPDREYMIFKTRHPQDIQRAAHHNLPHPRRMRNRFVCRTLCGLGYKLVSWGQYLVQQFELPNAPAHIEENPRLHHT